MWERRVGKGAKRRAHRCEARQKMVGTLRFAHATDSIHRHCEERSDEAIQILLSTLDCFASLAMTAAYFPSSKIIVAAFSAIIAVGVFVLPEVMVGMIEASATRRPAIPWKRSRSSTTA
jgi:hypothetical protein